MQLPLAALFDEQDVYDDQGRAHAQALQATGLWRGERRLRRRDGRLLWVQVSKRWVDEADPAAGLICSCVDVDERRRAREAVQLQAERTGPSSTRCWWASSPWATAASSG